MAFQVSPGVQVKEVDLTNVVPAVSSTTGAFAGQFQWGPVDEVVTVSSSSELVENFYSPADSDASAEDFYTADGFLRYGSSLRVVRVNSTGLYSANQAGGATSLLKNSSDYISSYRDLSLNGTVGKFTSRFAGALGNSLQVSVCNDANAYEQADVTTTREAEAVGQTIISITDDAVFVVGDIVTFAGHNQEYKITAIDTTLGAETMTIKALNQPAGTGLIEAVNSGVNISRKWEHYALFNKAPGVSAGASELSVLRDEMHIVVVDEDGDITGVPGTVLETHGFMSKASDAKNSQGQSSYYRNVIERDSQWIYVTGHDTNVHSGAAVSTSLSDAASTPFTATTLPVNSSLSAGANGRTPTAAEKYGSWDLHFADGESIDISFLVVGSTRTDNGSGTDQDTLADWTTIVNQAILLAETRKDCMVVVSPRRASVVGVALESTALANIIADADTATSSSYATMDSGWVYVYDRYHDVYRWVPGNGHTAGIMSRTDLLRDSWFSPAGFSRGQYLGITKLALNPSKSSRDDLYRANVNPIVTFPGQGTVLFGDKTMLNTPSAFDRINVRRLFITLEKAIATAAKAQLFEFNDSFTRAQFRAAVEPFLRDVQNRRGLTDFSVLCDETNNTEGVIDRNEFVCSIFVKPARSINFITLNFVAARSGVEFEEIYNAV